MRTSAAAALADLLRESAEWRLFYRQCCEAGAPLLRAQAWQFRDEISEREERRYPLQDVEDALLVAARKVLPGTPAAEWSPEWAAELCADALARLQEVYAGLSSEERAALELSAKDEHEDRMVRAGLANDPPAFRAALQDWEQAALRALEAARASLVTRRSGAA